MAHVLKVEFDGVEINAGQPIDDVRVYVQDGPIIRRITLGEYASEMTSLNGVQVEKGTLEYRDVFGHKLITPYSNGEADDACADSYGVDDEDWDDYEDEYWDDEDDDDDDFDARVTMVRKLGLDVGIPPQDDDPVVATVHRSGAVTVLPEIQASPNNDDGMPF